MADISKPINLSLVWASSGDVVKPSDTKIASGWAVEVPPRQWFNWLDNRQDQAIAHNNQHGIPVWDNLTEYQSATSLTMGSNGTIYRCKVTNAGNDPVTDVAETYWKQAFFENQAAGVPSDETLELPGGIVYKWGNASVVSGGTITFEEPFTDQIFSVVLTHGPGADNPLAFAISSQTLSGFTVLHDNGALVSNGFNYIAIGKNL